MVKFYNYILNHDEKCNKLSTDMSIFSSITCEIGFEIQEFENNIIILSIHGKNKMPDRVRSVNLARRGVCL